MKPLDQEIGMPLPHFLILLLAVIITAGITIGLAITARVELTSLMLVALVAATIAHLVTRYRTDRRPRDDH